MEEHLSITRAELAAKFMKAKVSEEDLWNMGAYGPDEESFDALMNVVYQSKVEFDDADALGCSSTEDGMSSSSGSEEEQLVREADPNADKNKVEHTVGEMSTMKRGAARTAPKDADLKVLLTHRTRGTAHWGHLTDSAKPACGKPRSIMYDECDIKPEEAWPRCSDCVAES